VVCSAGEGFAAMAVVKKKVVVKRKGSVWDKRSEKNK
jgi:hypothetical protein